MDAHISLTVPFVTTHVVVFALVADVEISSLLSTSSSFSNAFLCLIQATGQFYLPGGMPSHWLEGLMFGNGWVEPLVREYE